MTADSFPLDVLVVDDDRENLDQLAQLLPPEVCGHPVSWEYLDDFDAALDRLRVRRYDLLVSDIYRDRESPHKNIFEGDVRARDLVSEIRERRFCPIVLFTDGQVPENLVEDPFVQSVDKGTPDFVDHLMQSMSNMLDTGIPGIARRLHDELDRFGGSYVWTFLKEHWADLSERLKGDDAVLERIIRRRAAIQLARIDIDADTPVEREHADSADYYIYPMIGRDLRLGAIIRREGTDEFRVVLTPHCFLAIQPGADGPKADYVLTAHTVPAADLIGTTNWPKKENSRLDALRRRSALPASEVGTPDGRYCFLPSFMEIPDLYCDLMHLETLPYSEVRDQFGLIAVLDAPYAEALQASLGRLYATVGLPVLRTEHVAHLGPSDEGK